MTGLTALLLPIVVSAVVVFIVSSIIHMASPWHKNDYPRLPNEDQVMTSMRPLGLKPGDYFFPRPASRQDLQSPAYLEKVKQGPVVLMTVMTGSMSMGKNLALWFVNSLVIGLFAGYITSRALPAGAPYLQVFRFVGATAFLGYAVALWQLSIWYQRSWMITFKATVDGLIYALLTAGVFGWLWPR